MTTGAWCDDRSCNLGGCDDRSCDLGRYDNWSRGVMAGHVI